MRAALAIAAVCACVGLGCGHTRVADDTPPEPEASADGGVPEPRAEKRQRPPRTFAAGSGLRLSTSPEGQLTRDGVALVRERLRAEGDLTDKESDGRAGGQDAPAHLDDATEQALRAAQRRHGLPATGIPDDATVRALGLDPTRVFRRKE